MLGVGVKRLTLRIFGIPVLSLEVVDLVSCYEEGEDEDDPAVGGGSSHNFTIATPWVDERYLPWEEEDKSFGFGGVS